MSVVASVRFAIVPAMPVRWDDSGRMPLEPTPFHEAQVQVVCTGDDMDQAQLYLNAAASAVRDAARESQGRGELGRMEMGCMGCGAVFGLGDYWTLRSPDGRPPLFVCEGCCRKLTGRSERRKAAEHRRGIRLEKAGQ